MSQSVTDKTSADKTAIGFDYQYYFFLWKILSLRTGQTIGWEVKDDVHIETEEQNYCYQIKHTVQKSSSGDSINLTTYDSDLWKTIYNWVQVTTDKNDVRESEAEQLQFLQKTTFVLASNKSSSSQNKFTENLVKYHDKEIKFSVLKSLIQNLLKETKNNDISSYIKFLLNFDDKILELFLTKINFELEEDDIFKKCRDAIKADKVPAHKIDDTFKKIDSALREDNFITIKSGKKVLISFDNYYNKYRKYYDIARSAKLDIKPFDGLLPDNLEEQTFIKQLLDIGDIQSDNLEDMATFTKFKLQIHNNLEEWHQNGEITSNELESFKTEAVAQWYNEFRPKYRGTVSDDDINRFALNILDEIRKKNLSISEQQLGTEVSNGYYYKLSDEPAIGWRNDWQEKYKDES